MFKCSMMQVNNLKPSDEQAWHQQACNVQCVLKNRQRSHSASRKKIMHTLSCSSAMLVSSQTSIINDCIWKHMPSNLSANFSSLYGDHHSVQQIQSVVASSHLKWIRDQGVGIFLSCHLLFFLVKSHLWMHSRQYITSLQTQIYTYRTVPLKLTLSSILHQMLAKTWWSPSAY
jgi:hypothetical protein